SAKLASELDRLISADDVVGQLDDIGLGRVQAMVHFQESDLVLAEEHGDAQGEFQRLAGRSLNTVAVAVLHPRDQASAVCYDLLDAGPLREAATLQCQPRTAQGIDRKSTRLNSSHVSISYAVLCFKQKNQPRTQRRRIDRHDATA